jgi:hypothetical protein
MPSRCKHCDREFVPDHYNQIRQKYCKNPDCVLERKRRRQRDNRRKRYEQDLEFKKNEQARCQDAVRRYRAQKKSIRADDLVPHPIHPPVTPIVSAQPPVLLLGLLSQLLDTNDPVELARQAVWYEERGRRLAFPMASGG